MKFEFSPPRILDFDIECRPLSWIGGDWVTRDVTAIGAGFTEEGIDVRLIRRGSRLEYKRMLKWFVDLYDQADIVTGHYIRKFDLPNINAALLDFNLRPLTPKLVSDTKQDLVKLSGISASQESLSAMFGLEQPKKHMTQEDWRSANRLHRVDLTIERVTQDVRQHMELRQRLLDMDAISAPRIWYPQVRY